MTENDDVRSVRKLVDRALAGADNLPPAEKTELYQAAAMIFLPIDHKASEVAAYIAHLGREQERHQLQFQELLRS